MTELEKYRKALGIAMDALVMYAREDSYHAVAFLFDRPCGKFADDFSRAKGSEYNRPMPGKAARAALAKMAKRYGGLIYHGRSVNDIDKHRDEIGYVPKDDPRLNTIIGPPRSPEKDR